MKRSRSILSTVAVICAMLLCAGAGAEQVPEGQTQRNRSAAPERAPAEHRWRLAAQAWTFRKFTFFETVDRLAELGVRHVEAYPNQTISKDIDARFGPGMSERVARQTKDKLASAGVKLVSWGVADLPADEKQARAVFEWAKAMGIKTICSEPPQERLPMLDGLCQEFGINLALHNHPKPSRYWSPDVVLEAVKGTSKRVGACADTGHWVRSGLDPVDSLKKLEGRLVTLHLKDLNRREKPARDVPWGTGACDAAGMLIELDRQGWAGVVSMEYEAAWEIADLAKCVEYFADQRAAFDAPEADRAWQVVFDGKSLEKWRHRPDGWVVEDGTMARKPGAGFIWSKERYGDFVLELEYKLAPKTNSGVFFRAGDLRRPVQTAMEVQVLDSHGKDNVGKHDAGAIYDIKEPRVNAVKPPGQWNRLRLVAVGNVIHVKLNGEWVINIDLDRWTEAHKNPDGTENKFDTAYADMPKEGHIGFQDHGKPVWYRNVRIKRLD